MSGVTPLDVAYWNAGLLGLALIGLIVWPFVQGAIDGWDNRRWRKRRAREAAAAEQAEGPDAPSTTPGS